MSNDFTPLAVRLVGHRDLGVVQARWLGCILELEDGTRYGPSALFEVKPVPVVAEPAPTGPVLREWCHTSSAWLLLDSRGHTVAQVMPDGWRVFPYPTLGGGIVQGYRGGLAGREFAREWWLERGATDAPGSDFSLHDTRAIAALDVGGKVVLLDGTTKTVVAGTGQGGRVLFSDGTWMTSDALCDAVDSIVYLADQEIPF